MDTDDHKLPETETVVAAPDGGLDDYNLEIVSGEDLWVDKHDRSASVGGNALTTSCIVIVCYSVDNN